MPPEPEAPENGAASRYETAVEVLNRGVADRQVQCQLLLHGDLTADLVRPRARHAQLRITHRGRPIHIGNVEGLDEAIESGGHEDKRSTDLGLFKHWTETRWEAALLEVTARVQPVNRRGI